jgi:hypothetical protein
MTQRWAIIDRKTNIVQSCIIWDGTGRPPGGPDMLHVQHEQCDREDTYDAATNSFIKPGQQ